jgi:hypothetical protein
MWGRGFLCLWAALVVNTAHAQLGSWNVFSVKYGLSPKWSLFGEAQLRSTSFYNNFHYYEYKGGGTYNLDKNISVSMAGGNYNTYLQGGNFLEPEVNDEFRFWQQIVINQYLERIKIEHRYRLEQRWTSFGFRERYRFRVNMVMPINKRRMEVGTWYVGISNEVFLIDRPGYFERNRFTVNVGRQFTRQLTWYAGYVHQLDYRTDNETGARFFQIGVQIDIKRQQSRELVPSTQD